MPVYALVAVVFGACSPSLVSNRVLVDRSKIDAATARTAVLDEVFVDETNSEVVSKRGMRALRQSILNTIHNSGQFAKVLDAEAGDPGDVRDAFVFEVRVTPRDQGEIDWVWAWPAVYPMPGYWPIQPVAGDVEVRMFVDLMKDGSTMEQFVIASREPYEIFTYGFYRTAPIENAIARAYRDALIDLQARLRAFAFDPMPATAVVAAPAIVPPAAPPAAPAAAPAAVAGPQLTVAVLEFHNQAGLSEFEAQALGDMVREAALALPSHRLFVLTRENILQLLPSGADISSCIGDCEVETGRNIGAHLVVSGGVGRFGSSLRVVLKLHDTQTGRLLGSKSASGPDLDTLAPLIADAGFELFRSGLASRGE